MLFHPSTISQSIKENHLALLKCGKRKTHFTKMDGSLITDTHFNIIWSLNNIYLPA